MCSPNSNTTTDSLIHYLFVRKNCFSLIMSNEWLHLSCYLYCYLHCIPLPSEAISALGTHDTGARYRLRHQNFFLVLSCLGDVLKTEKVRKTLKLSMQFAKNGPRCGKITINRNEGYAIIVAIFGTDPNSPDLVIRFNIAPVNPTVATRVRTIMDKTPASKNTLLFIQLPLRRFINATLHSSLKRDLWNPL